MTSSGLFQPQPFRDSMNLWWENTQEAKLFLEHTQMQLSLCHTNPRPTSIYELEANAKPAQPSSVTHFMTLLRDCRAKPFT